MGDKKLVITIGRQYGSGGNEIGRKLAGELGIDFYDKNILRMNSDESGIKESYFHLADEKAGNRLLYRIISSMTPEMRGPSFGSDLIDLFLNNPVSARIIKHISLPHIVRITHIRVPHDRWVDKACIGNTANPFLSVPESYRNSHGSARTVSGNPDRSAASEMMSPAQFC